MLSLFARNTRTSFARNILVSLVGFILFLAPLHIEARRDYVVERNSQEHFSLSLSIKQNVLLADDNTPNNITKYMQCSITGGADGFTGCLAVGTYYAIYQPASLILTAVGSFFDIVLLFSISPKLISQDFIKTVWENVRDLANMAFIFILLWIAIATILRVRNNTAKELLTKLITVALLINFSLFITRVIIDAGNMFAMFFYEGFEITPVTNTNTPLDANTIASGSFVNDFVDAGEIKGVSGAFLHYTNINKIIENQKDLVEGKKGWILGLVGGKIPPASQHADIIMYLLLTSALIVVLAWVLFTSSFLFITRTAILWLLMAVSPLAFAGMILPQSAEYVKKRFWGELVSKSFCITVFLFLLWFTLQFLQGTSAWALPTSGKFLDTFVIITLKFTVLTAILFYAKNITKQMCDKIAGVSLDVGKKLAGIAGAAVGVAAVVGTGGAAAVLRGTAGKGAMKALNSVGSDGMTTRQRLASGNSFDRLRLRTLEGAEKSSFDARNTKLGGMTMDKASSLAGGVGMGKVTKSVGTWGTKRGEGGFAGKVARVEKKEDEWKKKLGDLNDKDPEKAAAARAAYTRYEDRLLQESGVTGAVKDIQKNSPYYQTLRKIASGKEVKDLNGNVIPMTQEEAAEAMGTIYGEQAKESTMKDLAEGQYEVSASRIAKARAAGKIAPAIKKSDEARERARIRDEERKLDTERFEAERDRLKGVYATNPAWADNAGKPKTPGEWRRIAEEQNNTLATELQKLNNAMKMEDKRERELGDQIAHLMPSTMHENPEVRNRANEEIKKLREEKQIITDVGRNGNKSLNDMRKDAHDIQETMGALSSFTKLAAQQSRNIRDVIGESAKDTKKDSAPKSDVGDKK